MREIYYNPCYCVSLKIFGEQQMRLELRENLMPSSRSIIITTETSSLLNQHQFARVDFVYTFWELERPHSALFGRHIENLHVNRTKTTMRDQFSVFCVCAANGIFKLLFSHECWLVFSGFTTNFRWHFATKSKNEYIIIISIVLNKFVCICLCLCVKRSVKRCSKVLFSTI